MKKNTAKKMPPGDVSLKVVPGPPAQIDGVVVGRLQGFQDQDLPLVDFAENPFPTPVLARTTVPLNLTDLEKEVVLQFENGHPHKPIILGLLLGEPGPKHKQEHEVVPFVEVDGEKIVVNANREIVLRCGEASITLTRAGKVLIKGEYVVTHSKGANKIKGGSVQIN